MKKGITIIFIILTLAGVGLLIYHLTNETSTTSNILSSCLIILANVLMYFALKKSQKR